MNRWYDLTQAVLLLKRIADVSSPTPSSLTHIRLTFETDAAAFEFEKGIKASMPLDMVPTGMWGRKIMGVRLELTSKEGVSRRS